MRFNLSMLIPLITLMMALSPGFADVNPVCPEFQAEFPQVRFYVEARGGFGDVVAGFYSALALAERCPSQDPVEIMAESEETLRALETLMGRMPERTKNLKVVKPGSRVGPAALEIHSAMAFVEGRKLKAGDQTLALFAPVFSDSESLERKDRSGRVLYQGRSYRMGVPGAGLWELGVYSDPSAARVAKLKGDGLKSFLIDLSRSDKNSVVEKMLKQNVRLGFAYGTGLGYYSTEAYFLGYLKSLQSMTQSHEPLVLLTPAKVKDRVRGWMQSGALSAADFAVIDSKGIDAAWMPEPGQVTIVETAFLSPELFAGLMAYSAQNGVVPMGAGDGFLSAAMELGIPFVMNQMYHNTDVVKNYLEHFEIFLERSVPQARAERLIQILREVYAPPTLVMAVGYSNERVERQMGLSQELIQFKSEYELFAKLTPKVLDSWIENALYVKTQGRKGLIYDRILMEDFKKSGTSSQRNSVTVEPALKESESNQLSLFAPSKVIQLCERLLLKGKSKD